MPSLVDLTGKKYTLLTVLGRGASPDKHIRWIVKCECGVEILTRGDSLTSGKTTSCGCRNRKIITKHGMHNTRIYHCWEAMINRCYNVNDVGFHRYGARGIKVCDKWRTFQGFYEDIIVLYDPSKTIDRINNDGNYEPGNVKWSTPKEQAANRRPPIRNPRFYGFREDL